MCSRPGCAPVVPFRRLLSSSVTWQPVSSVLFKLLHSLFILVLEGGVFSDENAPGMSEQVPAKVIILTEGLPRRVVLEKMTLVFRRAAPRALPGNSQRAGMVTQALRYLKGSPALARHLAQFNKTLDSGTMCAHRSRDSALCKSLFTSSICRRHVIREVLRASQGMSGRPQGRGMASTSKSPLHSVHENADVHVSVKTSAPTLASRIRASGALIPTLRRKWLSRCTEKSSAFHGPVRALRYGLHDGVPGVLSPWFSAAS